MNELNIPKWNEVAERLANDLHYSAVTLKRTYYTYRVFTEKFCIKGESNARQAIEKDIERLSTAYQYGEISRDQLIRMRRLAFRLVMMLEEGHISWKRAPLYEKKFGNTHNEKLLADFIADGRGKHATSVTKRDENIVRQFIIYCEETKGKNIEEMEAQDILHFLIHMKERRPAGLQSTVSAMKHFYISLSSRGLTDKSMIPVLRDWIAPHKKIYGVFTIDEKEALLSAIDIRTEIGKRDYAIFSLAIDCGIRSCDICSLTLDDINWKDASISFIQEKTKKQVCLPFRRHTGDALADYILHGRARTRLPFVFTKTAYSDSRMTSVSLCQRLNTHMEKAGIQRSAHEKIGMHTFRRSLGTELIDHGSDLEMVAQVLGHSGTSATKGYLSFSETALRGCALELGDTPGISEVTYDEEYISERTQVQGRKIHCIQA